MGSLILWVAAKSVRGLDIPPPPALVVEETSGLYGSRWIIITAVFLGTLFFTLVVWPRLSGGDSSPEDSKKKKADKRRDSESANDKRYRGAAKAKENLSKNTGSVPMENLPSVEANITEKTRQEITGIVHKVKSVPTIPDLSEAEKENLRAKQAEQLADSGVLEAMSRDLVSEVQSEEAAIGKFSKMMIQATLLFDDEISQRRSKLSSKGSDHET